MKYIFATIISLWICSTLPEPSAHQIPVRIEATTYHFERTSIGQILPGYLQLRTCDIIAHVKDGSIMIEKKADGSLTAYHHSRIMPKRHIQIPLERALISITVSGSSLHITNLTT